MLYFVLFLILLVGINLANRSFKVGLPNKKFSQHLYALGLVLVFFSLGTLLCLIIESFK